jgi:hypothetical protein
MMGIRIDHEGAVALKGCLLFHRPCVAKTHLSFKSSSRRPEALSVFFHRCLSRRVKVRIHREFAGTRHFTPGCGERTLRTAGPVGAGLAGRGALAGRVGIGCGWLAGTGLEFSGIASIWIVSIQTQVFSFRSRLKFVS